MERAQRALGVWDILFTHCCDSKARYGSCKGASIRCMGRVTPRLGMAPARERALGVWDVLFTHCCDSKARQHSPSLQCRPKGLPKETKKFAIG